MKKDENCSIKNMFDASNCRENIEKIVANSEILENHRVESQVVQKVSETTLKRNANKENKKLIVDQSHIIRQYD